MTIKTTFSKPTVIRTVTNITGSISNPTKATSCRDYFELVDDGSGWCEVNFEYSHNDSSGAVDGSGLYLFDLPTGYAFDLGIHPPYFDTTSNQLVGYQNFYTLNSAVGTISSSANASHVVFFVTHNATQFKFLFYNNIGRYRMASSAYYPIEALGVNYKMNFRFKKA